MAIDSSVGLSDSRAAPVWIVGGEITAIYALSTLPTPLYVMYRQAFGFSDILLTLIYAAYVVGTVAAMCFFGRLSDQIGRRPVVLASLTIAALSAIIFLLANGVELPGGMRLPGGTAWLFAARILSGLAIALASGASAAWIVELEPRGDRLRATRITIGANLLGLGMGALLAGVLAQFAPLPLALPYAAFLLGLVPVAWQTYNSNETVRKARSFEEASLSPRLSVPTQIRVAFFGAAAGAFAVFSVLGFYTALIPSLLRQGLHQSSHAVAGAIVGEIFLVGAAAVSLAAYWQRRAADYRTGLILSLTLLLPSVAMLVVAQRWRSLPLLLLGTAVGGVATGPGYQCSLGMVNELAPAEQRSGILSAYMVACYAGISLPVIGIGVLTQLSGSLLSDEIFAGLIIGLAILALLALLRSGRPRHP